MPTLYRDTGYSLTHLIEDIKHGKHRIAGDSETICLVFCQDSGSV